MLILASKSSARQNMLRAAGLEFEIRPAEIDESVAQSSNAPPSEVAQELARAKALHVAAGHPDALVIGSDQILECEGQILTKAANKDEAREKLKTLRGKTHSLISAVTLAKNDEILWQQTGNAFLTMHNFNDDFLESYIERAGEALTRSVGAYELESTGVQLFETIKGDYFTILGMPLLPLLTYLRTQQGIGL